MTREKNKYYMIGNYMEVSDFIDMLVTSNPTLTPFECYAVGCGIKYFGRLGKKPNTTKTSDLKKIINYCQQMIDRIDNE